MSTATDVERGPTLVGEGARARRIGKGGARASPAATAAETGAVTLVGRRRRAVEPRARLWCFPAPTARDVRTPCPADRASRRLLGLLLGLNRLASPYKSSTIDGSVYVKPYRRKYLRYTTPFTFLTLCMYVI